MRWISVFCIALILITGFSRNYLGVHTPQDVIVGLTEGVLILWGMSKLFSYLIEHSDRENIFLAIGVLLGIAALIYISVQALPNGLCGRKAAG